MKILATKLSQADKLRIIEKTAEVMPWILGPGWSQVEDFANGGRYLSHDGLKVIAEVEMQQHSLPQGGQLQELWLHVSFSREDRVPDYADMVRVKERFIGKQRKAIMVLPAESEHFSLHPNCLHWFCPLERDPLPDFREQSGGL